MATEKKLNTAKKTADNKSTAKAKVTAKKPVAKVEAKKDIVVKADTKSTSTKNKPIIKVNNLIKSFGKKDTKQVVLNDISFEIFENKITSIYGQSGSGKTTLLNILSGLERIDSGEILVDDINISKLIEDELVEYRLEKLGFVFQQYNLIKYLNVYENVDIVRSLESEEDLENCYTVEEILKHLGIWEARDKYPHQLSGGMQQRVSIARALIKKPRILVCDEPTGALDEDTGKDVLGLLQTLNKEDKVTVIIVTHNNGIKDISDFVINLKSGNIDSIVENKKTKKAKDIVWS